jgi:hypothetical protein
MKKEKPTIETFAAKVADKQDNPTIHELAKAFPEKTYKELERYRNEDRQQEAGICIMGEARKDRENAVDHYEDANYRQDDSDDVEVKIGHNETIWFRNECKRLVKERDKERKLRQEAEGELSILKGIETNRVKESQDALANALEVNESHRKLNGKLQERMTELEEDNKKLAHEIEDRVHRMRKSGL